MALLGIFLDGLSPESVAHMPSLAALPHRRRMRAELGYSIACHASMYTGVRPDRHGRWFVWQRARGRSAFPAWCAALGRVPGVDTLPGQLALNRLARVGRRERYTGWFGVPRVLGLPARHWAKLDVSEPRGWMEPDYAPGFPTIFERLARAGRRVQVLGMGGYGGGRGVERTLEGPLVGPLEGADLTLLFVGETDHLSHAHRQDSARARRRLGEIDRVLARRMSELDKLVKEPLDVIVWSDHGHVPVRGRVDLAGAFRRAGEDLAAHFCVIDAGFARFWLERPGEEAQIRRALAEVPEGALLDDATLARHRVLFTDRRFGDLVFLLRPGFVFHRTTWGLNRAISMHGYDPDHPGSDGLFLSSRPVSGPDPLELVDIPATLSARLGVPPLAHDEGRDRLLA